MNLETPHSTLPNASVLWTDYSKNCGPLIQCKLCIKKVKTTSYLNHRTLNGCPRMDPCFCLKNFNKKYEN